MKSSFFILIMLSYLTGSCQPITINGKVINEDDEPIPNATVTIKQSNKTTITNADGRFTFDVSRLTNNDTLFVSATGYEPVILSLPKDLLLTAHDSRLTVTLKRSAISLAEVIISTGYQDIPKERATGAFDFIDNKTLNRRISTGIIDRLENTGAVYFDRRNGSGEIAIRGRSTLFANSKPLIVIDNFPYEGDINAINPNDIESITILKDAAAASVWGAFSGNGVIIINTKKGKPGQPPKLELTANYTSGQRPDLFYDPGFLNAAEYMDAERFLFDKGYYNSSINNRINYPLLSPLVELLVKRRNNTITAADSAVQVNAWRQTDVRKEMQDIFYRRSFNRQYAINYSGASDEYNYFLSLGYDNNRSFLVRNSDSRITIRSSASFMPSSHWELNMGIVYAVSNNINNNPGPTMLQPSGKSVYPYEQLRDAQGNALAVPRNYRLAFVDTVGNGKLLDWKYRPVDELALRDNSSSFNDALLNFSIVYKPVKGLNMQLAYRYEKQSGQVRDLYRQQSFTARDIINLFTLVNGSQLTYQVPLGGILDRTFSFLEAHYVRGQFTYNKTWSGRHDVAFLAGAELRDSRNERYSTRLYGYDDELLTTGNVNYAAQLPTYNNIGSIRAIPNPVFLYKGVNRFIAAFANGSYTYSGRYILSVSARKDASNIFGVRTNQKWVPLWSSGLAWQLSKEKFYHIAWLPYVKMRVTYGYNGNVDNTISALPTILYSSVPGFPNNLTYADMNTPPNPELRWEKIRIINVGMDYATKNNRIAGSIDYYIKKGTDLIGQTPLDPTTGVMDLTLAFTYKGNVADMKGRGWELELNTKNLTGSVKWDTRWQFNYATNEITKYNYRNTNAAAYTGDGTFITPVVGKPVWMIMSYKWAGLDPLTGDPRGYDANKQLSKDYTALLNVKTTDLEYNGPALPVIYGFLTNSISWKDLTVSFNLSYKLGYYFRKTSINYNLLYNNWKAHADFSDRWQQPGDELKTNVPSMIYPNNSNRDLFYAGSSALVEKGDHIRWQDISLAWDIRPSWLRPLHIKELRLYAYINNIGIIWKANKAGLDPDYYSGGYPLPRTISFGLKTTF